MKNDFENEDINIENITKNNLFIVKTILKEKIIKKKSSFFSLV